MFVLEKKLKQSVLLEEQFWKLNVGFCDRGSVLSEYISLLKEGKENAYTGVQLFQIIVSSAS